MKSLTIHNIDDDLEREIEKRAKCEGKSLNQTIKKLLRHALGMEYKSIKERREDFLDLFGTWNKDDLQSFNNAIKDFEQIDYTDWR